jgi:hypothetical protein
MFPRSATTRADVKLFCCPIELKNGLTCILLMIEKFCLKEFIFSQHQLSAGSAAHIEILKIYILSLRHEFEHLDF